MHETQTHITLAGRPCVIPDPTHLPGVAQRANAFWCPLGPAAGRGWVLMLRRDLQKVLAGSTNRHALVMQTGEGPHARLELPSLLILHAHRLTAGAAQAQESLYLVELADKRWLVEQFSDTGTLGVNLRSFAQSDDYLTGAAGYTWSTAAEALWDTMSPILGAYPGLPAGHTPHGAPEDWQFIGGNAWAALGQLLAQIGCAVAYDPVADTFRIEQLTAAQANVPADLTTRPRLYAAEALAPPAVGLPETIRVYFHTHRKNFGQEYDTELAENWKLASHSTSIDVPTALATAEPGTILTLWDDLPHVLNEENAAANSAELTARAAARATAWLAEQPVAGDPAHQVFPGIAAELRPGAQLKAVLWRAWGPAAGGTATEIFAAPGLPVSSPFEPACHTISCTGGAARCDCRAAHRPASPVAAPDLAQHTAPSFPRVAQTVEVYQSAATPYGRDLAPNSAGLLPGRVVRYMAGTIVSRETCWLRPISLAGGDDPDPAELLPLRHGDRFVGRLSGIRTAAGVTRPVYLVQAARQPCRKFAARASGTLDVSASPLPFDLDTLEFDSGEIAELTAAGEILSHIEGEIELRYKVVADRLATAGGASHYECYVEQSNNGGSSWSEVADSRTAQICRHSNNGNSSVAAPAIQASSQNGTLFRLVFRGTAGPAEIRTRADQCQLFLTPCGGARAVTASYGLVAAFTPSATAGADEPSLITSELVLADHETVARGTGDEETHSWDFDATAHYLTLAARPLDTEGDFTLRVHFKLLAHPTVYQPFPLFIQHETGDTTTRDVLIQIYKQASDANSEIAAGVYRTGSPAAPFLINAIDLATWYTVYLRWDAGTGQAELSLVGGAAASSSTSGDRVEFESPSVSLGGAPTWSGSYGDIEIDSLRMWERRLADYELV